MHEERRGRFCRNDKNGNIVVTNSFKLKCIFDQSPSIRTSDEFKAKKSLRIDSVCFADNIDLNELRFTYELPILFLGKLIVSYMVVCILLRILFYFAIHFSSITCNDGRDVIIFFR